MSQAGANMVSKQILWLVSIALVAVAAVGAGLFTYVTMSPHTVTSVATAYETNTAFLTNTQTLTSYSTVVSFTTATAPLGYPYAQYCSYYGCQPACYSSNCQTPCNYYGNYNSYYCNYNSNYGYNQYCSSYGCQAPCYYCDYNYNVCQSPNSSSQTQCSGYLYQDQNSCVELVVPITSPYAQQVYQYYTLHNLPSSHPPFGSWVTVTGQLYNRYNGGAYPYGSACPGNYINVTSISQ